MPFHVNLVLFWTNENHDNPVCFGIEFGMIQNYMRLETLPFYVFSKVGYRWENKSDFLCVKWEAVLCGKKSYCMCGEI